MKRYLPFAIVLRALAAADIRLAATRTSSPPAASELQGGPTYDAVLLGKDVMIPMRDGTKLAVDIYRPARSGTPISEQLPILPQRTSYNNVI